jgi:hypothetical protein
VEARGFERVIYWIGEITPVVTFSLPFFGAIGWFVAWRAKKGQKDDKG